MSLAQREAIRPREVDEVLVPQEALDSVAEGLGVAFLPKSAALRHRVVGVVVQPLWDESLWFDTCLVMRADNDARITNEFARALLRKVQALRVVPIQLELPIAG
jgi:DNA-binding transcriptional LysR family regulator